MHHKPQVIFVCEHGAAKSIVASAWFNKLASERGLNFQSIARGTHPDDELSEVAIAGLQADGLPPVETFPVKLLQNELESARSVISFCELSNEEYQFTFEIEHWVDIPPVSDGYEEARDAILNRIDQLLTKQSSHIHRALK